MINIVGFMILLMGIYVFFILENKKTELKLAFMKALGSQQVQNISTEQLITYSKHTSVVLFSITGLVLIFNDFIHAESELMQFTIDMFFTFVYFITFMFQLSIIIVYREGKKLKKDIQ